MRQRIWARARRGFTLTELLVYLALVSAALVVFGTIEVGARRSVALQSALIDCESTAQRYLGPWRRDVEDARALKVAARRLEVVRLDGSQVVYTPQERIEKDAAGKERSRVPFALAEAVEFSQAAKGQVRAELTIRRKFGWRDAIVRTYVRAAAPRVSAP